MRVSASKRKRMAVAFTGALTAMLMWMGWTRFRTADGTRAGDSRPGAIRESIATPKPDVAGIYRHSLLSGETVEISIDPQQRDQPVGFSLALGEASRDDEPRAVRPIATDGRILGRTSVVLARAS
jgi:hypothetical protein